MVLGCGCDQYCRNEGRAITVASDAVSKISGCVTDLLTMGCRCWRNTL